MFLITSTILQNFKITALNNDIPSMNENFKDSDL